MFKRIAIIFTFLLIGEIVFSQQKLRVELKEFKQAKENIEEIENTINGFILKENINVIELFEKETKEGPFNQLLSEGMSKTYDAGKPGLPVINRLFEIPPNHTATVELVSYEEEIINLKDYGLEDLVYPAQPSVEKSKNLKDIPFYKDDNIYKTNAFYKKETITFEDLGYLRNRHLGYIELSPFSYNPVTNTLKVLSNLEVKVEFVPTKPSVNRNIDKLKSPYFESINYQTINTTSDSKSLVSGPVKYVIVSDRMFEETLQPFIEWKTKKGFIVVEAYTDEIGSTETEIQSYLQDLYDNPDDGISPTFGLLVGDVDQIPAFDATSHYTDLYYFEYTGDKLPEVFYGRFSAESIEELQPQIDKTLEIEKYEMPDPSYLDNVVLVAGVDGSYAPTHGNGAINYANDYYTNSDNGINSYYYLYNDDSGVMSSNNSGASASIRSYISAGVSFSNYTAHCGPSGWSDPSFSISHIDGLTNEHMYPLIIGNCCQSNTFDNDDCFGEEILMAENKGAVGYIGGSNNTYWDEDYYWGVGLASSITANPTYEETELGAYDRFFHLNGESQEDWYITQGQISVAGNLAVQASTSSLKTYYWEIYHLMGDPSLTPYVTVPTALVASYNPETILGTTSFNVVAEENAYVALSQNGVLLDAQLVDASGSVDLSYEALSEVGKADIVITKQNRQPIIDEIDVIPAATPYVLLSEFNINDDTGDNDSVADYGELLKLNVEFENLSDSYDAFNTSATLTSADTNIIITDNLESLGTILRSDSVILEPAFTIQIKNKLIDQHNIEFNVEVTGEDSEGIEYLWISKINFTVNAPQIELEYLNADDNDGNDNGIIEPGESGIISVKLNNTGNSAINNISGIVNLHRGTTGINLINEEQGGLNILPNGSDTLKFEIYVSENEKRGSFAEFLISIEDLEYNFYEDTLIKEIIFGELIEYTIDTLRNVYVATQDMFYDSGGKESKYTNSENDTITFYPENLNGKLEVEFYSFDVEPNGNGCYDYLEIYDGENTNSTLLGAFCNSNTPTNFIASNEAGALTFRFYSDGSVVHNGWEAKISNAGNFVKFVISDNSGIVENAVVEFNNEEKLTNSEGEVSFDFVANGEILDYLVRKENYDSLHGNMKITNDTTVNLNLDEDVSVFRVSFNLSNGSNPVYNACVVLNEDTVYSDPYGEAVFESVEEAENIQYNISKTHYNNINGTVDVKGENVTIDTVLTYTSYLVNFRITDSENPLEGAIVEFNEEANTTDINGECSFNVQYSLNQVYKVSKEKYESDSGMVNVDEDKLVEVSISETKLTGGIANLSNENIKVYPNPSNGRFTIEVNDLANENCTIKIFNVIGSNVYTKEFSGKSLIKEEIDITRYAKGMYFVSVETDNGSILSKRILVK